MRRNWHWHVSFPNSVRKFICAEAKGENETFAENGKGINAKSRIKIVNKQFIFDRLLDLTW